MGFPDSAAKKQILEQDSDGDQFYGKSEIKEEKDEKKEKKKNEKSSSNTFIPNKDFNYSSSIDF